MLYQKQGGTKSGGFAENHKFGKYEFRPLEWGKETERDAFFVGNMNDFPQDISPVIIFKELDKKNKIAIFKK